MNVKDSFKSPALMLLYGIVIGFAIVGAILLNSTYDDNPEVSLSNPQVSLSNPEVSLSNPEVSVTITDDTHLREEIAQLSFGPGEETGNEGGDTEPSKCRWSWVHLR